MAALRISRGGGWIETRLIRLSATMLDRMRLPRGSAFSIAPGSLGTKAELFRSFIGPFLTRQRGPVPRHRNSSGR